MLVPSHASSEPELIDLKHDRIGILECSYYQGGGSDHAASLNGGPDSASKQGVRPVLNLGIYKAVLYFADSANIVGADSLKAYLSRTDLQDRFYTAFMPLKKKFGFFNSKTMTILDLEDGKLGERLNADLKIRYLFIPISHFKERETQAGMMHIPQMVNGKDMNNPGIIPWDPSKPFNTYETHELNLDFEVYDLEKDTIVMSDRIAASADKWWFGKDYQMAAQKLTPKIIHSLEDSFKK